MTREEKKNWLENASAEELIKQYKTSIRTYDKGDCTNGGISAERRELYILDSDGPFEPSDIRECVIVERKMILGHEHINAKPVYCQNKWYMMGGNFLYTSDSRFREYTGLSYPIPIHDRYEGR